MKFRSEFKHGFTNHGCLHCAILKSLHGFKEKGTHKSRDMQLFFQNVQNEIFKILKCFKTTRNSPEQPACKLFILFIHNILLCGM